MFPVLFSWGSFTLYTFGPFLVLAFLATGFVFWKRGREEHYAEDELFDAFLLTLLWGILWSRIGFILVHLSHFGLHVWQWIDVFSRPGMEPLFGLIAGTLFLYRYAKNQKWDTFEVLDYAAVSVAVGSCIIWIGSFFAGAGFGNPTNLPWGIYFPGVFDKRQPTQLYAALVYFFLAFFLSWAEYHYRTFEWYRDKKHSAQTGFLFCVFVIVYGLAGIFLSTIMSPEFMVAGFSLDIPIHVLLFILGLALLYHRSGRSFSFFRKSSTPSTLMTKSE